MEHFLVPQFIEIEPKIIGPITVRQFILMLVAGLLDFLFYKIFFLTTFIGAAAVNTLIFGVFAFVPVNGMPFHFFVLNIIQTLRKPRLRVWQKIESEWPEQENAAKPAAAAPERKRLTDRELKEIALSIDTGGAYAPKELKNNRNNK